MKTRLFDWTTLFICSLLLSASSGMLIGCDSAVEGSLPRRDRLNYPVGMAFHPDGKYFYVVNSNFDARYRPNAGGTVSVIDSDTLEILPENTPYLPSFGAQIALNEDATKAYVATRAGDAVVAYDISADGSALFCTNAEGVATSDPSDCILNRAIKKNDKAKIPADPFDLAVFSVDRPEVGTVDVINLAHLAGTKVSTITLPGRELSAASFKSAPLLRGANAITQRPGTHDLYVAGRQTSIVAIFQPYINDFGKVEALLARGSFALNHQAQVVDARGLVFSEDGTKLYVLTRNPDALHFVDIVPGDSSAGRAQAHKIVASIPLRDQPADMALHTTPGGRRLAYITSSRDRSVQVIDLDSRTIIDDILLDSSPYNIIIEPHTSGCASPQQRCRAFVSLFKDTASSSKSCSDSGSGCGTVAVIDINPLHRNAQHPELSSYHTVIKKIQ